MIKAEKRPEPSKEKLINPRGKLFGLLRPYRGLILLLVGMTSISNGLNLYLPWLMQQGIDTYTQGTFSHQSLIIPFVLVTLLILLFSWLQNLVQTYASEKVALDLRQQLANQISEQSFTALQEHTPAKLLTFLTSDIDSIKIFISMAIASLVSSLILIVGASTLLLLTHWQLALAVLMTLLMIAVLFIKIFRQVRFLFRKAQEAIDKLNRVINESILGSALIRVLNTQKSENEKFLAANSAARDNGLLILKQFAGLMPWVAFIASLGSLILLVLGGHFVIDSSLTLGEFTAFNTYLGLLIFPIMILGFMSSLMARASASYARIETLLNAPPPPPQGQLINPIAGEVRFQAISLYLNQKPVLKDINFVVPAGSRTAIIGPTAAGKTTLLFVLAGLIPPDSGQVIIDGQPLEAYDKTALSRQIGFVFQDSALFNLTLRENIAFNQNVSQAALDKAIAAAELGRFVEELPLGLETIVSERGISLSGGQKQRIILARALALNPRLLLLDDFTSRVDALTEQQILTNIARDYPELTMISVTQKIAAVENYEQILLLMEGELIANGTHTELMTSCPEYVQIYQSQRSTQLYEAKKADS